MRLSDQDLRDVELAADLAVQQINVMSVTASRLIDLAARARAELQRRAATIETPAQLRIEYDDDQLAVVEKINDALSTRGLVLVDDDQQHDGYCIYTLEDADTAADEEP